MRRKEAAAKLPEWIDAKNPGEVRAFEVGFNAGRLGKPRPDGGRFYVVAYAGWVEGRKRRREGGAP